MLLHSQNESEGKSGLNKGFTLIETLVAVAVLLIAIAAPLTLMQRSLSSATASKDNVTAANLARDALEYVKNVRDTNLKNETDPWTAGLDECIDKICTVDTTASVSDVTDALTTVTSGGSPYLKYNSGTNKYGYSAGTDTTYRREVSITTIDPDREYRVQATVTWTNRGIPHTYTVGQNLFKLVSVGGCEWPAINGLNKGVDPTDPNFGYLDCGMLLHWTFDSADVSGTTIKDTSGNNNHGTYYGSAAPTLPESDFPGTSNRGQAITLDGSDDKIYGPTLDLLGDFTLTAWVRTTGGGGVTGIAGSWDSYKFKKNSGPVEYMVKTTTGGATNDGAQIIDDGAWHHVAMTFDTSDPTSTGQSTMKAFVDGVLDPSGSGTVNGILPAPSERHFTVGCWATGGGECFTAAGLPVGGGHWDGQIDDVRIYGRTLDDREIAVLYTNSW